MEIKNIIAETVREGRVRVSATMNDRELWFDFPDRGTLPATLADSFAIMGLAPSMLKGEALVVPSEFPVSATLLSNFEQIQNILHCWNPIFKHIPVQANPASPSPPIAGAASMYSGGVDSMHTLSVHRSELTHAILIGGFDLDLHADAFEASVARNRATVEYLGKELLHVHTNQRAWGATTGVWRTFWHSAYLAAVALFFRFDRVLIPSSHSYAEIDPSGSHLILDPLWSNGCTEFRHVDAQYHRTDKVAHLATDPYLLANLRVCWNDQNANCGECQKCLRTMVTLDILGVAGPFPRRLSLGDARSFRPRDWDGLSHLIDNALFAHAHGRKDLVRASKAAIRRYDRRQALTYIDRGMLFGLLHRLRKKFRPYDRHGLTSGRPDQDI